MSILIKGMEMPKDYSVIVKIFPDGRVGTIPYVQWFKVELIDGVQAVPVPSHGRLGDLDRLEQMFADIDHAPYSGFDGIESFYSAEDAAQIIRLAPTVIPAEEG